jgi:hypothetical protein
MKCLECECLGHGPLILLRPPLVELRYTPTRSPRGSLRRRTVLDELWSGPLMSQTTRTAVHVATGGCVMPAMRAGFDPPPLRGEGGSNPAETGFSRIR